MNDSTQNEVSPLMENGNPSYREQLFEVLTFCFLVVPGLAFSFVGGGAVRENFLLGVLGVAFSDLAMVTLIVFFLWHNREKFSRIGWVKEGFFKEVLIGIILYVPLIYSLSFLQNWLEAAGLPFPKGHVPSFLRPQTPLHQIIMTFMVVIVAFSEETIFRGYLILRYRTVTRSTFLAVIIASLIFAAGHGYEGYGGVVIVGIMGVVFALVYLWRKSLVAPMVMHFLQDFLAIVLLPILAGHQ